MKRRSLERRLILWFSAALLLMAALTFVIVFSVSHSVLQKLLRMVRVKSISAVADFSEDDIDLLEDVLIENKQAIEMVDMHRTILESMMDGFASVINNNVNQVMKFLAAITIILSIPTMLASFWGMNVGLPLTESPLGFWYVVAASAVLTIFVILFFRKKKMF